MKTLSGHSNGTFAIAPTSFDTEAHVDMRSIDSMRNFYHEVGCDGITVFGAMGEAPELEAQEAFEVARQVVCRSEGLPSIVGVSSPGFVATRSPRMND
jgi:4-hydroxy-tetrahydrodipicolinate synthase